MAIALAIWQKSESPDLELQKPILVLGELHLDRSISPVKGVLPAVILSKKRGVNFCIIPNENLYEVDIIQNITIWGVTHLLEAIERCEKAFESFPSPRNQISLTDYNFYSNHNQFSYDFSHIKGHHRLKRALEIAAAGGHHVLMCGPPGSGKTLSAKCFPSILPPLKEEDLLETNKIWPLVGKLDDRKENPLLRPFREPHHSASLEGMF